MADTNSSGAVKICKGCGTDVTNKKRFKDSSGKYLCAACGDKEMDAEAARKDASRDASNAEPGPVEKFKAMPKWKQITIAVVVVVVIAVAWWVQGKLLG